VFASFSRAQDTFPFQSSVLKIKEQGQIQLCDIQISEHLSYVRVGETDHHFGIDDHSLIHNQIRNKVANQFTALENGECFLDRKSVATAL